MATDPKKIADDKSSTEQPAKQSNHVLQWLREGLAGIISLVVLAITAMMMYGTYNYARETPANAEANFVASRKESYQEQKDIMLYALALLGTVTGYYLGRVPAELHAQQAERSANTAQNHLQTTQTKLIDISDKAAVAAKEVTIAEKEKHAVKATLSKVTSTLVATEDAISKVLSRSSEPKVLGERTGQISGTDLEDIIRAKKKIEDTLREIREATDYT